MRIGEHISTAAELTVISQQHCRSVLIETLVNSAAGFRSEQGLTGCPALIPEGATRSFQRVHRTYLGFKTALEVPRHVQTVIFVDI